MLVPVFLSLRLYSGGKPIWLKLRCVRRGLLLFKSERLKRGILQVYYFRGLLNDDVLAAEIS